MKETAKYVGKLWVRGGMSDNEQLQFFTCCDCHIDWILELREYELRFTIRRLQFNHLLSYARLIYLQNKICRKKTLRNRS